MRAMAASWQFSTGSAVVSTATVGILTERFLERPTQPRRRRNTG
jgi:hypothetical protein